MSKSTQLSCDGIDCKMTGLEWEVGGWFTLSQFERTDLLGPLLIGPLNFCSLPCLNGWVTAANQEYPRLAKTARSVSPRGTFTGKVKGLAV